MRKEVLRLLKFRRVEPIFIIVYVQIVHHIVKFTGSRDLQNMTGKITFLPCPSAS